MQEQYRQLYNLHARTRPFASKVDAAMRDIDAFLAVSKHPYASWSGGKDSTCLLLLLSEMGRLDVPIFTQGDDLDWPEKHDHCHEVVNRLGFTDYAYRQSKVSALDQFARLDFCGTTEIRGTFSHVIEAYERECGRDGALLGVRAEESRGRCITARSRGTLYRTVAGMWRGTPLAKWSGEDVFALIVSRRAPVMGVYELGGRPPHEIRMSWLINPAFLRSGAAVWVRRRHPEYFRMLAELNPKLRSYA